MNIPTEYSEWINCFEVLKTSPRNPEYINTLKNGKLEMNDLLANRFIDALDDVIKTRIVKSMETFTNNLGLCAHDVNMFSMRLIEVKKEFAYLYELVNIPVIPDKNKEAFKNALKSSADMMQSNMEEKVASLDRIGVLSSTLKNNPVNNLEGI